MLNVYFGKQIITVIKHYSIWKGVGLLFIEIIKNVRDICKEEKVLLKMFVW